MAEASGGGMRMLQSEGQKVGDCWLPCGAMLVVLVSALLCTIVVYTQLVHTLVCTRLRILCRVVS